MLVRLFCEWGCGSEFVWHSVQAAADGGVSVVVEYSARDAGFDRWTGADERERRGGIQIGPAPLNPYEQFKALTPKDVIAHASERLRGTF